MRDLQTGKLERRQSQRTTAVTNGDEVPVGWSGPPGAAQGRA